MCRTAYHHKNFVPTHALGYKMYELYTELLHSIWEPVGKLTLITWIIQTLQFCYVKINAIWDVVYITWGSKIPELQNRVTHYDVINRVTNSNFFLLLFLWDNNCYFGISNSRFLKKIKFQKMITFSSY